MHLNTLKDFRHEVYQCFGHAKDALFNLADALVSEDRAQSLIELSLSPHFTRRWPSLYEALEDGRIDEARLRETFLRFRPPTQTGGPVRIAVDVCGIDRPKAVTSADRSAHPVHNLPEGEQAMTCGWQFSTVTVLPETPSSWTYVLDQQRVSSQTTAQQVAFSQLRQITAQLPATTIVLLDRAYDSAWLWGQLSTLPISGALIRLKKNRCLYRPAPARTGKRGAPRKRGDKLQPEDRSTHADPSGSWQGQDHKGHPVHVWWWKQLTLKEAAWMTLTVIRVERPRATQTKRDPRFSWFVWIGQPDVDLAAIALSYVHRFSQEHGYRFDKQSLLWDQPHLRTPEQFERWSQVVAIVHNLLVLARDLVTPELRPWEQQQRAATPQHVRRAMSKLLPQLGTPARPPQPRGKSPGRQKGATIGKAERFRVIRQKPKVPPLIPR